MIDVFRSLLGKRWYHLFTPIQESSIASEAGDWALKTRSSLEELVQKNELVLADWEGASYDPEKKCLRVCGFLSSAEGSVFKDKIAGTTMIWEFGMGEKELAEMIELAKQRLTQDEINIFMHGHTGDAIDLFQAVQAKRELDTGAGIASIQLSLGLMGADGSCLSSTVGAGETGVAQVSEAIDLLAEKLESFKSRVGLVWGHSMQGYTTIEMAAMMQDELPSAMFVSVAPVIHGSQYDVGKPYEQRHVYLHAGLKGAIVQMLPVIGLIPTEQTRGAVMKAANFTGIPAIVLGSFVRQKATAAIHFAECARHPNYLKRVNNMLYEMADLEQREELEPGIERAVENNRLVIVYGERDGILNPIQMKEYARKRNIPTLRLAEGHFPTKDRYPLVVSPEAILQYNGT